MKLRVIRIGPGGVDHEVGTLSVENARLVSDPPDLAEQFEGEHVVLYNHPVKPADGDGFLTGLLHRYGRGSYLRMEREAG